MLICSTIFLENEAIVISGRQWKWPRRCSGRSRWTRACRKEDLELSQDNVAIGEWHQSSGIVPKTLSKIKFASREVAKIDLVEGAKRHDWLQVDGQRRALREKEETQHHRGSEDQVPEQGETRHAVGGGEAVEGDRD